MDHDELVQRLTKLLEDLEFDYDRMSRSGQETYEEIMSIVAQLKGV